VLPLDGRPAFGDPFRRTHELVALLELRAAQLRGEGDGRHERRFGRLGSLLAPAARRRFI
jgi:hypothetical protein